MNYEEAEYLHCSVAGSFWIPCTISGAEAVMFDLKKYGTPLEQIHPRYCNRIGKLGYEINYHDPLLDEFVYKEWRDSSYIKRKNG